MGLGILTRQAVAFEPPLAPSFPFAGMESVEVVEPEPPLALSFSAVKIDLGVFESEPS